MKPLVASTARVDGGFAGVLRAGAKVAWRCDHVHKRRDQSTMWTDSAVDCARVMLMLVKYPTREERLERVVSPLVMAGLKDEAWVAVLEAQAAALRERFGVGLTAPTLPAPTPSQTPPSLPARGAHRE